MQVLRPSSANEFLASSMDFRSRDPYRTNLMGSVATSIAQGTSSYEKYHWWIVQERDEVVGIAMRTAPHGMVLSPMSSAAAAALASQVADFDDALPEVSGPVEVVGAFVQAYLSTGSAGSSREYRTVDKNLLYALDELIIPQSTGTMVRASQTDFDFVLDWYEHFARDAELHFPNIRGSVESVLVRDALRFWIVDGERTSMAGFAPPVEGPTGTIARVGPVYTPAPLRGKGFAGALTAHLSQELLDQGYKVMLYTDANNPTSNGVYQRIGYTLIDENEKIGFGDVS